MPRVLYLAYHFPPMGGGGVQRNSKFVRYLPALDWEPIVVTGCGRSSDHWTPPDDTLLDDIGGEVEIHRLPGPEPQPSEGRRASIERRLMRPGPAMRYWMDGALELGSRAGRGADLLYASLVPYETAQPAAALARQLGIPWVADLQDPWALDEMWLYPSALHHWRDKVRMHALLKSAAAIVMNTPEASRRLLAHFPDLRDHIVVAIPNGFDESDFPGPEPPARADGRFRIVHTGYLHTDQGTRLRRTKVARRLLGGTYAPVDILTRSHVYLLAAIEQLIEDDPGLRARIEVVLAGLATPLDRETAERHPYVRMPGYVSHGEAIALMRSADLLFLPMQDLQPPLRAGLVPGKTYEYLASRRPILAAVPDGDARELLAEAGNAILCRPADTKAIAEAIAGQLERHAAGLPAPTPAPDVRARYDRRRQARDLAGVFARVASRSGAPLKTTGDRPWAAAGAGRAT